MGKLLNAAVKAAAGKAAAGPKTRGVHTTTADRKVHCRFCGCPVRSRLGAVCSKPRCQRFAVDDDPERG